MERIKKIKPTTWVIIGLLGVYFAFCLQPGLLINEAFFYKSSGSLFGKVGQYTYKDRVLTLEHGADGTVTLVSDNGDVYVGSGEVNAPPSKGISLEIYKNGEAVKYDEGFDPHIYNAFLNDPEYDKSGKIINKKSMYPMGWWRMSEQDAAIVMFGKAHIIRGKIWYILLALILCKLIYTDIRHPKFFSAIANTPQLDKDTMGHMMEEMSRGNGSSISDGVGTFNTLGTFGHTMSVFRKAFSGESREYKLNAVIRFISWIAFGAAAVYLMIISLRLI